MSAHKLLGIPFTRWDVVLGAGGIKGFAHSGFLQCVQDSKIRLGVVYGASIGSACAALYTNGYSPQLINQILLEEIRAIDKAELTRFLWRPNPVQLWKQGGFFDLKQLFATLVRKYDLTPNDSLAIVSYCPSLRKPVVFRGTEYNLADALSASCALPLFMRSQCMDIKGVSRRLVDGGLYHPNPDIFCSRPTLISALGLAKRLPRARLSWPDWVVHLSEMVGGPFKEAWTRRRFKENTLLVRTGMPNVATMTFGVDESLCLEMNSYAYRRTAEVFSAPRAQH